MTSTKPPKVHASAQDYVDHARILQRIAWESLEQARPTGKSTLDLKVSIGLTLQAAELVGKGMLRALGDSTTKIRRKYSNHDVLAILRAVEDKFERDPIGGEFDDLKSFLCWSPTIDGRSAWTTIGAYLEQHFKHGAIARPRSYFYPDEIKFAGPIPIDVLHQMVDELIRVAIEVIDRTR